MNSHLRSATFELLQSFQRLIQSELLLAQTEAENSMRQIKKETRSALIAASLIIAGGLLLLASLVISLGLLLNGNYWLSALVIGILFCTLGGLMVLRHPHPLNLKPLLLPQLRHTLLRRSHQTPLQPSGKPSGKVVAFDPSQRNPNL